jgi:hypothetical protein
MVYPDRVQFSTSAERPGKDGRKIALITNILVGWGLSPCRHLYFQETLEGWLLVAECNWCAKRTLLDCRAHLISKRAAFLKLQTINIR